MSWMARLYQTYEQAMTLDLPDEQKLMPISHTLQNAHINVVINGEGDFLRAQVLEKTQVVLPATEKSAGRSGKKPPPHPLADKILYVAGDYLAFGGLKQSGFSEYKALLGQWCESEFTHQSAQAILKYITKSSLVADLIAHKVMYADGNQLLTKWSSSNEQPPLFKVLPKEKGILDQGSALICWTVERPGCLHSKTWLDNSLQQSWIDFDALNGGETSLCFVTGKQAIAAVNHPAKVRHSGDKAKLISSNDNSGFTFRGKFLKGDQASVVSFDVTQKAHNALRWLVSRQGFRNGEQVFLSWAISGEKIPEPTEELWPMFNGIETENEINDDHSVDVGQSYALKLKALMTGYLSRDKLKVHDNIVIMGLDSATPGRMGVIYYRETIAQEYIDTLMQWHTDLAWPQRHKQEIENINKKTTSQTIWPICAPSPYKIWTAVYGDVLKSNDTLKKNLIERLMPCIVEGKALPIDIVNNAVKRATNRVAYKSDETWLWEQNLGIACALYKGFCKRTHDAKHKKDYDMALEIENTSRDYLFGRLLAIAEKIEETALLAAEVKSRATSANRLMQRFSDHPYTTWLTIYKQLNPYMRQLQVSRGGFMTNRNKDIDEIMAKFNKDDFCDDSKLSGEFLLGFHCQRLELNRKNESTNTIKES